MSKKPKVTFVIAGENRTPAGLKELQDRLNEAAYGDAEGSKKGDKIVVLTNGSVVMPFKV